MLNLSLAMGGCSYGGTWRGTQRRQCGMERWGMHIFVRNKNSYIDGDSASGD